MQPNRHRQAAALTATLVWWLIHSAAAAGVPLPPRATIAMIIAPVILARAGVLTNVAATVFPGVKNELLAGQARYAPNAVVCAGRIVTSDGPASAAAFAQALLRVLRSAPVTP